MSIGTSIFLSVILLSLVLLFNATKDRWKWKKIILFSICGLVALCLFAIGTNWLYKTISNLLPYQDTFRDIPISASKSDVKFLKGEPSGKSVEGNLERWEYRPGYSIYYVGFKGDKIRSISHFHNQPLFDVAWRKTEECKEQERLEHIRKHPHLGPDYQMNPFYVGSKCQWPSYADPMIQGIGQESDQETVIKKFGTPSYVSVSKDDLTRVLSFKKYGVFFTLGQNQVVWYGIYNPTFGPIKLKEEKE